MANTATKDEDLEPTDSELDDPEVDELDDDWDEIDDVEDSDSDDDGDAEDGDDGDDEESGDSDAEALDELEAEELEMLTDDEQGERLVIDEAEEMRAIRRAEISMAQSSGTERSGDEFQCQSCFLVKKVSQLADKRNQYCRDCT